jgi:2-polyprenyl-3-methyl-5-hydroxy-6-metoxy-1,4-benzoquinol methylase
MENQHQLLSEQYSQKSTQYYGYTRAEMFDFIPQHTKSLLDVGCSAGGFGKGLKNARQGIEVWGIEPSADAARIAASVLDKVIVDSFGADVPGLAGRKFDCIVFNDVLEHLVNPAEALSDCLGYLNPGGSIVASIPNILFFPAIFKILKSEDWKYESAGTLDNTHLRFFTKKSIVRLFEENGFVIKKMNGIHAEKGKLYRLLNLLTCNRLRDWKYTQFAVQAQPS